MTEPTAKMGFNYFDPTGIRVHADIRININGVRRDRVRWRLDAGN